MKSERTKTLMINIAIGALIILIFYIGYSSFKKDAISKESSQEVAGSLQAEQALVTSQDVSKTFNEFDSLKKSIASSIAVFSYPAFRDLKDFSIEIFPEPVGRENPFGQTSWKAQIESTIK